MKKIFKSRTVLGIISIVLALVVCLVAAPAINSAAGKQTEIVRVKQNISKGEKITQDMVETVKVGGYNLPANVLKSASSVKGKYALAALQSGDYILSTKISGEAPSAYLSELDGKNQAMSISIKSFAAGLSGKLEAGDVISIYIADYGDTKETIVPNELKYVKLLAATTSTGTDTNGQQKEKNEKSTDEDMPSTLTLLVSPAQAEKLVDYEANGKIYAALAYRGTEKEAQNFLDEENQYLNGTAKSGGENNE